ncbi:putative membrane protein [Fluviicoccus keumensis]|uniref:Putative membrane protein n=1 Tax=Fluviicoccus keumensis TaxID=1435465 RepID=A0A4Q7YMG4_9GAMM|nr:bestrophin family ion channel [Fluviicoccus keumensis]RZU38518.1 putative membrane protein [Fluviicoccus keumensis]
MIVRPREHWLRMLFIWRGSVLPRILPQLAAVTGIACLVTVVHGQLYHLKVPLTFVPFTLIGIALAVFLGFRNSASYDRYWEGRKLWGVVLGESRTLARQILTLPHAVDAPEQRQAVLTLAAIAYALRHQLRRSDAAPDLQRLLPPDVFEEVRAARFAPNLLVLKVARQLQGWRQQQRLDALPATEMEPPLARLTDAICGCERLNSTPLPYPYSVIMHRTTYLYCFLLPFGLVDAIGWTTPLMVAFIAYTFFALEALSDELEEPFGTSANDLPLAAMCVMIETTLREMLGGEDLPPAMEPVDYVLL